MLTIRDLPAIIERAILSAPRATVAEGVRVETLRAQTEVQILQVIDSERDRAHELSAGNLAALEATIENLRAENQRLHRIVEVQAGRLAEQQIEQGGEPCTTFMNG